MIATSTEASPTPESGRRLGSLDVLVLSAWCGLAAGGARGDRESSLHTLQLYAADVRDVPALRVAGPTDQPLPVRWHGPVSIRGDHHLAAASGLVEPTAHWRDRDPADTHRGKAAGSRRGLAAGLDRYRGSPGPGIRAAWRQACGAGKVLTFPVLMGFVLVQAASIFGGDQLERWREERRPLPPAGSPNVLLVVLDTVRSDHLSLYGYDRQTSPALELLACEASASIGASFGAWTLASHATMFTGRWPHELGVRWLCPMRGGVPTLAEFVSRLGYATAGFVGNTLYCSYDSGLGRGFTHYEDYVLDTMAVVRTAQLAGLLVNPSSRST